MRRPLAAEPFPVELAGRVRVFVSTLDEFWLLAVPAKR